MFSLPVTVAANCLLAMDQVRLNRQLAYLKVSSAPGIELLIKCYQEFLDLGDYSLCLAATPDCTALHLHELILEQFQTSLPKKYKMFVAGGIARMRRQCWETVASWREWRFNALLETAKLQAPFLIVKQGEYLKSSAIQELRDLNRRLSLPALILSDRPLQRAIEKAEGNGRFSHLECSDLLEEGLAEIKALVASHNLHIDRDFCQFFTQIQEQELIAN